MFRALVENSRSLSFKPEAFAKDLASASFFSFLALFFFSLLLAHAVEMLGES